MPFDRRVILLFAGVILIFAAWLLSSRQHADAPVSVAPPVIEKKLELLVAKQALEAGALLTADKVEWISLMGGSPQSNGILREYGTVGDNPYLGRLVIRPIAKGDALISEHFTMTDASNYIAQQLRPGMRAYAISIDTKGTVTAGNFILPNDHVDILRSFNSTMGLQSETILTNIRVLAVGQTVHGEGLSTAGDTATVEVDLHDAEILATAQRTGQISLALRNPNDSEITGMQSKHILIIRPSSVGDKTQ